MPRLRSLALVLVVGCGAPQATSNGASACSSDEECGERLRDHCPGGSVTYAQCTDGACRFEGCSSPIGTPCDDDPATVFEDEDCPESSVRLRYRYSAPKMMRRGPLVPSASLTHTAKPTSASAKPTSSPSP